MPQVMFTITVDVVGANDSDELTDIEKEAMDATQLDLEEVIGKRSLELYSAEWEVL